MPMCDFNKEHLWTASSEFTIPILMLISKNAILAKINKKEEVKTCFKNKKLLASTRKPPNLRTLLRLQYLNDYLYQNKYSKLIFFIAMTVYHNIQHYKRFFSSRSYIFKVSNSKNYEIFEKNIFSGILCRKY